MRTKKLSPYEVVRTALTLYQGQLSDQFEVLATSGNTTQRRHASIFVASTYAVMSAALDAHAFSPQGLARLERGFWNAAGAARYNSKEQGLTALMWGTTLREIARHDERALTDAIRVASYDPDIRFNDQQAKALASHVAHVGMLWRPEHWSPVPSEAIELFNKTAQRAMARVRPGSAEYNKLADVRIGRVGLRA